MHYSIVQRWEFLKENRKKKRKKNSTKKLIKENFFMVAFLVEFLFS